MIRKLLFLLTAVAVGLALAAWHKGGAAARPRAAPPVHHACLTAYPGGHVNATIQGQYVTPGRVVLPGQQARLSVRVTNAGDGTESMKLQVRRHQGGCHGPHRPVPPAWVRTGRAVTLNPGESVLMPLALRVPADAKPGRYLSDLIVYASVATVPGRENNNDGAGTLITFRVARPAPRPAQRPGLCAGRGVGPCQARAGAPTASPVTSRRYEMPWPGPSPA